MMKKTAEFPWTIGPERRELNLIDFASGQNLGEAQIPAELTAANRRKSFARILQIDNFKNLSRSKEVRGI